MGERADRPGIQCLLNDLGDFGCGVNICDSCDTKMGENVSSAAKIRRIGCSKIVSGPPGRKESLSHASSSNVF